MQIAQPPNPFGGTIDASELGFDALQKVAESTISNDTTVSFTGLDLEGDGPYVIFFEIIAAASSGITNMYYNGDSTDGNYDSQTLQGVAAAAQAAHYDTGVIMDGGNGLDSMGVILITKQASEVPRAFAFGSTRTAPYVQNYAHVWTTTTNVTQIDFTNATANGMASGYFIVYKVGRT